MKYYDFLKAKQFIDERIESISEASLGMHEDWFWTAQSVFENGAYTEDLKVIKEIGGLSGSQWATPVLQVVYKDGEEEFIDVSTGEHEMSFGDRVAKQVEWTSGCMSSEVQANIKPISK